MFKMKKSIDIDEIIWIKTNIEAEKTWYINR
jgi:hypothetical protein